MIDVEQIRKELQELLERREISGREYFRRITAAVKQWKLEQRAPREKEKTTA